MGKLFFETPGYTEGKYLVKRRDGTIPIWPHFVLGAADPIAPWALRAYALFAIILLRDWSFARSVWRFARHFANWRRGTAGMAKKGDPNAPPHRKDDPLIVAEMQTHEPAILGLIDELGDTIGLCRALIYEAGRQDTDYPGLIITMDTYAAALAGRPRARAGCGPLELQMRARTCEAFKALIDYATGLRYSDVWCEATDEPIVQQASRAYIAMADQLRIDDPRYTRQA